MLVVSVMPFETTYATGRTLEKALLTGKTLQFVIYIWGRTSSVVAQVSDSSLFPHAFAARMTVLNDSAGRSGKSF